MESLGGGVDVNGQLKNYYAAGNMPDIFAFGVDSYKASFSEWLEPLDGSEKNVLGITTFGASAPGGVMMEKYGFTVDNLVAKVKAVL